MSAEVGKSGTLGQVHWALYVSKRSDLHSGHLLDRFSPVVVGICLFDFLRGRILLKTFFGNPVLWLGFYLLNPS